MSTEYLEQLEDLASAVDRYLYPTKDDDIKLLRATMSRRLATVSSNIMKQVLNEESQA